MVTEKKRMLFEGQAKVIKAMAHPLRIAILDFLKDSDRCVCDIAEHVNSERSNVSRHLSVLVNAGVLESRKEGIKVFYRLKAPCILKFFSCITDCLKVQVKENDKLRKAL